MPTKPALVNFAEIALTLYKNYEKKNDSWLDGTYISKVSYLENLVASANTYENFVNELSKLKETNFKAGKLKCIIDILYFCHTVIENKSEEAKVSLRNAIIEYKERCEKKAKFIPDYLSFSNAIINYCYQEIKFNLLELYVVSDAEKLVLMDSKKVLDANEAQRREIFDNYNLLLEEKKQLQIENNKVNENLQNLITKCSTQVTEIRNLGANYQELEKQFIQAKNDYAQLRTNHSTAATEQKKLVNENYKLNKELNEIKKTQPKKSIFSQFSQALDNLLDEPPSPPKRHNR